MSAPWTYGDSLLGVAIGMVILCGILCVLVWVADRPRHAPRHRQDDTPQIPPLRSLARRTGGGGAARLAGPGGATSTADITIPTARPYADQPPTPDPSSDPDTTGLPPLVVHGPPGARGVLPSDDLQVPVVKIHMCGLCHDGEHVIGDTCIWCGEPARDRAVGA